MRSAVAPPTEGRSAEGRPAGGRRSFSLGAFRLTTSFTAATIVLGVLSTKVLAAVGGPEAIALSSVFRNVGLLVNRALMLGLDTLALQRISAAKDEDERRQVTRALVATSGVQLAIIVALGLALALVPKGMVLRGVVVSQHLGPLWMTLAMAFVNMAMQLVISVLNAVGDIRRGGLTAVVAAAATVVLIYPLVRLGEIGLAINVGSGSVIGLAVGIGYLAQHHRGLFSGAPSGAADAGAGAGAKAGIKLAKPSVHLTLQPLFVMSGLLYVQGIVGSFYGVEGLGSFAAATLILDTAALVVMSGARSYVMPTLARTRGPAEKATFFSLSLKFFCIGGTAACLGLVVGAPVVSAVLFGGRFTSVRVIIALMALSLPAQAIEYSVAALLSSQGRFRLTLLADTSFVVAYVLATLACTWLDAPVFATGIAYCVGHYVAAFAYLAIASLSDEGVRLDPSALRLGGLCGLGSVIVFVASERSYLLGAPLALAMGWILVQQLLKMRSSFAAREVAS